MANSYYIFFSPIQNFAAQYDGKGVGAGPGPMVCLSLFILAKKLLKREFTLYIGIYLAIQINTQYLDQIKTIIFVLKSINI